MLNFKSSWKNPKLIHNLDEILVEKKKSDIIEIIEQQVFLSNISVASDHEALKRKGITHCINWSSSESKDKHSGISYFDLKLHDCAESDLLEWIERITKYIADIKGKTVS